MKKTKTLLLLILFAASSIAYGMNSHDNEHQLVSFASYQNPPEYTSINLPHPLSSTSALDQLLQEKNAPEPSAPDPEPELLQKHKKEKLKLIRLIAKNNTAKKYWCVVGTAFALNAIKDIVIAFTLGSEYPSTDLIPSNHLMPLHKCYRECYASICCTPLGNNCPCVTICNGPYICKPEDSANKFGKASMWSYLGNLIGIGGCGLGAFLTWKAEDNNKKKLKRVLDEINKLENPTP